MLFQHELSKMKCVTKPLVAFVIEIFIFASRRKL